jgi:ribonuclease R
MKRPPAAAPEPRPFRVARWGKFWSLEPVFADERAYLVAKGHRQPRLNELVLAVPTHGNRWQIVESLGMAGELEAVLRALLCAERIRQGFADDVLAEAAAAGSRAARPDAGRRDLTTLPTFTIDPDTARDFDDAISVAREGAAYRAHVHIADVAYFVEPGGPIDSEARERTSSVYLPLWAEPMLPEQLSADLCSLRPGEPRKCITAEFTFSAVGERTGVEFYRSLIRSDDRLTYGFVDGVLVAAGVGGVGAQTAGTSAAAATARSAREGGEPGGAAAELVARITLAHELAEKLRRRRFARGALQIGSFEPEYRFAADGHLIGAVGRPESPSHGLVEEFMLAANEAVAGFLAGRRAHAIYRVHEPPDAASAEALLATMEELSVPTPPLPTGGKASAAQVAQALRRLSEIIAEVSAREGRGRLAFPQRLLRSLKQAYYSPENLGHFGLASAGYLHFTSPIRRYPDLVVHRALLAHLGLDGSEISDGELAAVAAHCSTQERTLAKLELKADDIALAFLLEQRLTAGGWDEVFQGEIIGSIGGGIFVHFGGIFEGYLPARKLGDEWFAESPHGSAQVGAVSGHHYRLGDGIAVNVNRVDTLSGKVDLLAAGEGGEGRAARSDKRAGRIALDRRKGGRGRGGRRRPGVAPAARPHR